MIEKYNPMITVWHHEACRVVTIGDHVRGIFYLILTRILDSFSCSLLKPHFMFENSSKMFLNTAIYEMLT